MKLLRVGAAGAERPGLVLADSGIADLSGVIPDVAGAALSAESLAALRKLELAKLPRFKAGDRLGPCVGSVGKFIAIGPTTPITPPKPAQRFPPSPSCS